MPSFFHTGACSKKWSVMCAAGDSDTSVCRDSEQREDDGGRLYKGEWSRMVNEKQHAQTVRPDDLSSLPSLAIDHWPTSFIPNLPSSPARLALGLLRRDAPALLGGLRDFQETSLCARAHRHRCHRGTVAGRSTSSAPRLSSPVPTWQCLRRCGLWLSRLRLSVPTTRRSGGAGAAINTVHIHIHILRMGMATTTLRRTSVSR